MAKYPKEVQDQAVKARKAKEDFDNYSPSGLSDLGARSDKAKAATGERDKLKSMLPGGTDKLVNDVMQNANDNDTSAQANTQSYKKGVDRVPTTGLAKVHKGEAVLNKKDAEKYRKAGGMQGIMDLAAGEMAHPKREEKEPEKQDKPKKEIKEVHIRKAKNGGHIVTHKHTRPEHHPDEEHIAPDMDALHEHLEQHMGEPNPGEADADAGQSGGANQMEQALGGM